MKHSALLTVLACTLNACGGTGAVAAPPAFEPEGQTTCGVVKSPKKPLIVEWPATRRAELETVAQSGLVVVRYDGCDMEVLSRCHVASQYQFIPTTPKQETIVVRNSDDLYATIPVYAAAFEGKLASAGELNVDMMVVGRLVGPDDDISRSMLRGTCEGASHVVHGLSVGAFEFFAGASAEASSSAGGLGLAAGISSKTSKETLRRDGTPSECKYEADQSKPPRDCSALLGVEVVELVDDVQSQGEPQSSGGVESTPPRSKRPSVSVEDVGGACEDDEFLECRQRGYSRCQAFGPPTRTTLRAIAAAGCGGERFEDCVGKEFGRCCCDRF